MSTGMKAVNEYLMSTNHNEALTIEKWRPIAADTFPALYLEHTMKGLTPLIAVIELRDAIAHVFYFGDQDIMPPELMILKYEDGKPICFRRR